MDKRIGCIILFIFSLALAQQVPEVEFLGGVRRLSNTSVVDYYYSCCTAGATLQWEVNQDAIGFNAGDRTGSVNTSSSLDITYTATLLSSRLFQGGVYTFNSVLIVSSTLNVTDVACTNGIETTPISNSTIQNVTLNVNVTNIVLQYQFSGNILCPITTYFYLCEVNDIFQSWVTNTETFAFSNRDSIGTDRILLTVDEKTVVQQALLIANNPPVSVLLVTGITGVNVTCRSRQLEAILSFSQVLSATTMTAPPPTTETSTTDIDISTDNCTQIGPSGNAAAKSISVTAAVIIGIISGICAILAVVLVFVCIYICVLKARDKRIPIGAVPLQPISPGSDNKA